MPHRPKPTRLQLDLREETALVPGRTVAAWGPRGMRLGWTPTVRSQAMAAECACPKACIRDHENE